MINRPRPQHPCEVGPLTISISQRTLRLRKWQTLTVGPDGVCACHPELSCLTSRGLWPPQPAAPDGQAECPDPGGRWAGSVAAGARVGSPLSSPGISRGGDGDWGSWVPLSLGNSTRACGRCWQLWGPVGAAGRQQPQVWGDLSKGEFTPHQACMSGRGGTQLWSQ